MNDNMIHLTNVRVAGVPTFFPAADPKKHKCTLTAIKNRGKNKTTGEEMTDEFQLVFWGPYAKTAALYLDVGRSITVEGTTRSWRKPTGGVRPSDGKAQFVRENPINVSSFEFGPDSKKHWIQRLNTNLIRLRALGKTLENVTAEELMEITRPAAYDFDISLATQTGKYGNARVYVKGTGFLGGGVAPRPAPMTNEAMQAEIRRLQMEVEASKANQAAVAAPGTMGAGAGMANEVALF